MNYILYDYLEFAYGKKRKKNNGMIASIGNIYYHSAAKKKQKNHKVFLLPHSGIYLMEIAKYVTLPHKGLQETIILAT